MKMRMRTLVAISAVVPLSTLVIPGSSGGLAQTVEDGPACLVGRIVEGAATGSGFMIFAPRSEVEGLILRGFVETGCGDLLAELPDMRRQICEFAETAPEAILENFRRSRGISASEICSLASRAGGAQ